MNILTINCHPDYENLQHATNKLTLTGEVALKRKYPDATIEMINLYDEEFFLPRIDKAFLNQLEKSDRQVELIRQWKTADLIFIYSPLHNFNVTSKFKDYLDQILIAGETFNYTENGSVGLLSDDDHKVAFILSSGSDYSQNIKYINLDFAPLYLRGMLSLMGISNLKLIRSQGLDIQGNDRQKIVAQSQIELEAYIQQL